MQFLIDTNYDLVQTTRAVDAILESDSRACVPVGQKRKFRTLEQEFRCKIPVADQTTVPLDLIGFSHSKPEVRIGQIARPLLFSRRLVNLCKSLWKADRSRRFMFPGLLTDERISVIRRWGSNAFGVKMQGLSGQIGLARKVIRRVLGVTLPVRQRFGELEVWSSERGRYFPYKVWDRTYFLSLCESQFVLCPDGDFPWTYRFFEAVLCGAIPVVQTQCSLYRGFFTKSFEDDPRDFNWSYEVALQNFEVAFELLTCESELMARQLDELVRR